MGTSAVVLKESGIEPGTRAGLPATCAQDTALCHGDQNSSLVSPAAILDGISQSLSVRLISLALL